MSKTCKLFHEPPKIYYGDHWLVCSKTTVHTYNPTLAEVGNTLTQTTQYVLVHGSYGAWYRPYRNGTHSTENRFSMMRHVFYILCWHIAAQIIEFVFPILCIAVTQTSLESQINFPYTAQDSLLPRIQWNVLWSILIKRVMSAVVVFVVAVVLVVVVVIG